MKVGDIVSVLDGSYTMGINVKDKKFQHIPGINLTNELFHVLAINQSLPAENIISPKEFNDTIILGRNSGNVIFIQERFLRFHHKVCPSCGVNID